MKKIFLIFFAFITLLFSDTNIILVHGFKSNSDEWKSFVDRLTNTKYMKVSLTLNQKKQIQSIDWRYLKENNNYEILTEEEKINYKNKRVFVIDFSNNNTLTFAEQGFELNGMINDIARITNIDDFILIGHSMGGLAIRSYVQTNDSIKNIKKIITLDTPHQGAGSANYWGAENNEKLEPNSDSLTDLNNPIIRENKVILSHYSGIEIFFLGYSDDYTTNDGGYYYSGDSVVEIESQLGSKLNAINPKRFIFSSDVDKNNMNYGNSENHSFLANEVIFINNQLPKIAHSALKKESSSINKIISLLPTINFCSKYNKFPFLDNDGDINLHYWTNNIQLENCINPNNADQAFSAVFKTSIGNYIVEKGFWDKYKENSFGVDSLGNPKSNEETINSGTCQNFEKGVLVWNQTDGVRAILGNDVNCNNYNVKFSQCFSDILDAKNSYRSNICNIKNEGFVIGYTENNLVWFKPLNPITRAEFTKIVLLKRFYKNEISSTQNYFTDIDSSLWEYKYVNFAKEEGIINGFKDGEFKSNKYITYAQASKVIVEACIENDIEDSSTWKNDYITALNINLDKTADEFITREEMAYIIDSINCKRGK